jgi:hypothetical protein
MTPGQVRAKPIRPKKEFVFICVIRGFLNLKPFTFNLKPKALSPSTLNPTPSQPSCALIQAD